MISEEKQKALEAALGNIEKQFGKGSVMKLGDSSCVMQVEAVHYLPLHWASSMMNHIVVQD